MVILDACRPICRTVSDAVHVLDTIVGFDPHDFEATREASKYIPRGGYAQFLKLDGLKGKRIGIVRSPFSDSPPGVFKNHLKTMRYHYNKTRHPSNYLIDRNHAF